MADTMYMNMVGSWALVGCLICSQKMQLRLVNRANKHKYATQLNSLVPRTIKVN